MVFEIYCVVAQYVRARRIDSASSLGVLTPPIFSRNVGFMLPTFYNALEIYVGDCFLSCFTGTQESKSNFPGGLDEVHKEGVGAPFESFIARKPFSGNLFIL